MNRLTGQSSAGLGTSGPEEQLWQELASQGERGRVEVGVACGQVRVRVVARLVIVVLDVEVLHFAVVDTQRAARVVYVLAIEVLKVNSFLQNLSPPSFSQH